MTLSTGKNEFSNWYKGQPDNGRGNQDCALNNNESQLGHWDDFNCLSSKIQAMCEASGMSSH